MITSRQVLRLLGSRVLRIALFVLCVFLTTWLTTKVFKMDIYKRYDVQLFYNLATYIAFGVHGLLFVADLVLPARRRLISDTIGFIAFAAYIFGVHYSVYPLKSLMFVGCMAVSIYVVHASRMISTRRLPTRARVGAGPADPTRARVARGYE